MQVELHILQNFAPSNLNRDDTGSPKDCEFGGYRRARVSSQSWKRAMRAQFDRDGLIPPERRAKRTRQLVDVAAKRLVARGRDEDEAQAKVEAMLRGIGLDTRDERLTEYLLFLGEAEIGGVVELCNAHWDEIPVGERQRGRQAKSQARAAFSKDLASALRQRLDGGRAADIALFGRMIADRAEHNIDAAAQVAHAFSTNRVSVEFDYYTAVDDLNPETETGAGMIGTVEFNSACYYRYLSVDTAQLLENLGGDAELARTTLQAFLSAAVSSVPSGKQNSFAAQNRPSLAFAVVRDRGQWSLANAFVKPVAPTPELDLVAGSVRALDRYWGRLAGMYGDGTIREKAVCTLEPDQLDALAPSRVDNLEVLFGRVLEAVAW